MGAPRDVKYALTQLRTPIVIALTQFGECFDLYRKDLGEKGLLSFVITCGALHTSELYSSHPLLPQLAICSHEKDNNDRKL